jgi:predicted DNA binding CopG/RHH family protein
MSTGKKLPILTSDEAAERFVAEADLTQYDLSGFVPSRFEFEKKAAQINLRVPEALLAAVKQRAAARGMPFTRYIRMLMEQDVAGR